MRKFHNIESWASNLGYVVEKLSTNNQEIYVWYKEKTLEFKVADGGIKEIMDKILEELRSSYEGKE